MNSNYLTNGSPTPKQPFLQRRRIDVNSCKRRVAKYLIHQKQGESLWFLQQHCVVVTNAEKPKLNSNYQQLSN